MGIFDDIVQGVGREISRVQARSQEMLQTYSLNSQIRTLEGKITATFIEIGRLVYDRYERKQEVSEDMLKDKTQEIVKYEQEMVVLKAEMEALRVQSDPNAPASQKAEVKAGCAPTPGFCCPHCNSPANKEKSFCPSCGGDLHTAHVSGKSTGNGSSEDV
ncbi:MAG: hypothetical protein HY711_11325 [Candidatus Melainabacteria bacterium]|nr:hypothetical protein [Candidatus Melainabacteria bacterium]